MSTEETGGYVLGVDYGQGRVEIAAIDRFPFAIGRDTECDLVIADPSVSRRHAFIRRTPEGIAVVDNGSRNGVYVNGERITGLRGVRAGDTVHIGSATLKLKLANVPEIPHSSRVSETVRYFPSEQWDLLRTITTQFPGGRLDERARRHVPDEKNWQTILRLFLEAPLPDVYEHILDIIEERVPFDRSFIILFKDDRLEDINVIARRVHAGAQNDVIVSRDILQRVARSRESVVVTTDDVDYVPTQSWIRSGATIAICVPLTVEGKVTGVIYLDRTSDARDQSQEALEAVGPLAGLVALKIENVRLLNEHVASQVFERDLKLAKEILERLLPQEPLSLPNYIVEGYTEACYEVGGDYIDFFCPKRKELTLVIGDVSGKGLSSALYVAGVRAALRAHLDDGLGVDAIMNRLEKHAQNTFRTDHFLTLFIGMLDAESGVLTYCNAGHMQPICLRAGGEVVVLEETEPALNIMAWEKYGRHDFELRQGDILLMYTDGIVEMENPRDEQFGIERLAAALARNRDQPLASMRKSIIAEADAFAEGRRAADDRTLILLKRE